MKKIYFILIIALFSGHTFAQYTLVNAFPSLSFTSPVFLTHSGDGTNKIFVVQQGGLIKVFQNDSTASSSSTFLNVSARIAASGEEGLLGLAFHPNYASNRYLYIYYSQAGTGSEVIARFTRNISNPLMADSNSQLILLTIPHPNFTNHNGGMLFFGLDGYLYFGTGDGGSGGDPNNNAQNVNVLLGKISRINVDSASGGNNYSIPPTNPFYNGGGRGEIFTWGMRNPWRFTQDPVTGQIWCADVGQNLYEEIDIILNGQNYGWRIMEGFHCYNPPTGCNQTGLTLPIKEYGHNPECSIIGGYIYRGLRRPELTGRYIYGDYCSGKIWKLYYPNGIITEDQFLVNAPSQILSFGSDQNRELYVLCSSGSIYKFDYPPIGITPISNEIPKSFSLLQNYPNPFNPCTKIRFEVPLNKGGNRGLSVKLIIYDALGSEVSTLVNQQLQPGTYEINWDASSYPSGVYFYQMVVGDPEHSGPNNGSFNFIQTKKMVLIK
jgi:glucose/arabinose dehydrogenase